MALASTILNCPFNGNGNDVGPNGWNMTQVGTDTFIQAGCNGGSPSVGMEGPNTAVNYWINAKLNGYLTSTASVNQIDIDIYPTGNTNYPAIFYDGAGITQIYYYSGSGWYWFANGVADTGTNLLSINVCHHLEIVFGASTKLLYIDGVLDINTSHNGQF